MVLQMIVIVLRDSPFKCCNLGREIGHELLGVLVWLKIKHANKQNPYKI